MNRSLLSFFLLTMKWPKSFVLFLSFSKKKPKLYLSFSFKKYQPPSFSIAAFSLFYSSKTNSLSAQRVPPPAPLVPLLFVMASTSGDSQLAMMETCRLVRLEA